MTIPGAGLSGDESGFVVVVSRSLLVSDNVEAMKQKRKRKRKLAFVDVVGERRSLVALEALDCRQCSHEQPTGCEYGYELRDERAI